MDSHSVCVAKMRDLVYASGLNTPACSPTKNVSREVRNGSNMHMQIHPVFQSTVVDEWCTETCSYSSCTPNGVGDLVVRGGVHLLRRNGTGRCSIFFVLLIIGRAIFNSSDRTHVLLTPAVRKIHTSQHHHHLTQVPPPHSVFQATQRNSASMSH